MKARGSHLRDRLGIRPGKVASGFTLTELLVVIAVVGLLLALSAPALARVKRAAIQVRCSANLRQLGLMTRMFVDDYGCYPPFAKWEGFQLSYWPGLLAEASEGRLTQEVQSGRPTVFACPSPHARVPAGGGHVTYGYNGVGYAFKGLSGQVGSSAETVGGPLVKEAEILVPSDLIMLGDGMERTRCGLLFGAGISLKRWLLHEPPGIQRGQLQIIDGRMRARHGGRAAVVFADGHVWTAKLESLFEDTSDAALERWNRDHAPHREWLVK